MKKVNIIWPSIHVTPNMAKGLAFEKWVVGRFEQPLFTLLQWQSDKYAAGVYPSANRDPDLVYKFSLGNETRYFAVECKWREKLNSTIEWASSQQLERYQYFREKTGLRLFILIGLGGYPSSPNNLFIVPFDDISDRCVVDLNSIRDRQSNNLESKFYLDTDKMQLH